MIGESKPGIPFHIKQNCPDFLRRVEDTALETQQSGTCTCAVAIYQRLVWHPPTPRKFLRLQLLGLGVTLTLPERWRKSSAGDGVSETKDRGHFHEQKTSSRFPVFRGI